MSTVHVGVLHMSSAGLGIPWKNVDTGAKKLRVKVSAAVMPTTWESPARSPRRAVDMGRIKPPLIAETSARVLVQVLEWSEQTQEYCRNLLTRDS